MDIKLKAEKRKLTGRKVKQLRAKGIVPANIFGKKIKSLSVQASETDLNKIYQEAGETSLIEIDLAGDKTKGAKRVVLISDVQTDPVTDKLIHVDFREVDLKQKVNAQVPVELTGESPAEKQGLGTVVQYISEVEVKALPADLLESFELDQSVLVKVDDALMIKDLKFDKNKISIELDDEEMVAKVDELRKEEEPAPTAEGEEELAEGEEAKGEGETDGSVEKEKTAEPSEEKSE